MKLPMVYPVSIPASQRTIKISAIVESIRFFIRVSTYGDVVVP